MSTPTVSIEKAKELGFCFGVRRAIELTERAALHHGAVDTLGPLVHNERVVSRLEGMGIRAVAGVEQVRAAVAVIPSHGAAPGVAQELRKRGAEVVDATCPIVHRAQKSAQEMAAAGFRVLLFGKSDHAEVRGVLGWAGPGAAAIMDARFLPFSRFPRKLGVLCQTTQSPEHFSAFLAALLPRALSQAAEIRIINTICQPTRQHQAAAKELARRSDIMLVVGSFTSENTGQLTSLCEELVETHQVKGAADIAPDWLRGKKRVGITAGASTPDEVVAEVVQALENLLAVEGQCSIVSSASI